MPVPTLAERLAERIRSEGPIRFDLFQEAALYEPQGGYYERPGRVGRAGDFITAASWHPAFARSIARIARDVRAALGASIEVVDVGAGEGELLTGIRDTLKNEAGVRLFGVERSAVRRGRGVAQCPEAAWFSSLEEVPEIRGLAVAYELFDALPVRALLFEGGALRERVVALDARGGFAWETAPCPDGLSILEALHRSGARLRSGQLLEIRPGAGGLARALASRLSAGLLLVFDYGASARALYSPARPLGTLEAFLGHRVSRDVLAEPGSRDITAWVDFTELAQALASAGLDVRGPVSQSRVLLAAGIAEELADDPGAVLTAQRAAERNAIGKLFLPGGMGESIRVLVAERGTALGRRLTAPIASGSAD